jgi:hypothetical protein
LILFSHLCSVLVLDICSFASEIPVRPVCPLIRKMATSSSLTTKLQGISKDLLNNPILHSKRNLIFTAVTTALSFPLLYITWSDYQKWLELGRAGPPHNIFGYLISRLLQPLKASRFDTSFISNARLLKKIGPVGERAFLKDEDVPERKGPRPEVCKWILPQRQLDQKAGGQKSTDVCNLLDSLFWIICVINQFTAIRNSDPLLGR